jgi:hypothetical protein
MQHPDVLCRPYYCGCGERIERFRAGHPVGYLRKPVDFPYLLSLLSEQGCASS